MTLAVVFHKIAASVNSVEGDNDHQSPPEKTLVTQATVRPHTQHRDTSLTPPCMSPLASETGQSPPPDIHERHTPVSSPHTEETLFPLPFRGTPVSPQYPIIGETNRGKPAFQTHNREQRETPGSWLECLSRTRTWNFFEVFKVS